jgi:hypothetical protein
VPVRICVQLMTQQAMCLARIVNRMCANILIMSSDTGYGPWMQE